MGRRHFNPALEKAKLRRVRFHDLRHTFAALLIAQREHPKYIQNQMGYHSTNVIMDVY
jgi:integrase